VGAGELFLIAGPCVYRERRAPIKMAEVVKGVARSLKLPYIFKPPTTSQSHFHRQLPRAGIAEGLRILRKIQQQVGVPCSRTCMKSRMWIGWPRPWTSSRFRSCADRRSTLKAAQTGAP